MEAFIIVLTTFGSKEEAQKVTNKLLKARLIACANIIDKVDSFFHWQGKIENEQEVIAILKTQKKHLDELFEWIQTHHSYSVPEILALPIVRGSGDYLAWIKEETS